MTDLKDNKIKIRWHAKSNYRSGGVELRDRYSGRYLVIPADQVFALSDALVDFIESNKTIKDETPNA